MRPVAPAAQHRHNQPFPHAKLFPIWGLATLALICIGVLLMVTVKGNALEWKQFKVEFPAQRPVLKAGEEEAMEVLVPVTLKSNKNIRILARADLERTGLGLVGLLYPKDDKELIVQPFQIEVWHAVGVKDGEAWTDDNRTDSTTLSSLPGGEYVLRLNVYLDSKDSFLKERLRKKPGAPARRRRLRQLQPSPDGWGTAKRPPFRDQDRAGRSALLAPDCCAGAAGNSASYRVDNVEIVREHGAGPTVT